MLQFNTYHLPDESDWIRLYVAEIRREINQRRYDAVSQLVQENQFNGHVEPRFHLINARLALWGILDPQWAERALSYAEKNSIGQSFFNMTELLTCCSEALGSGLYLEKPLARFLTEMSGSAWAVNEPIMPELLERDIHYVPRRSGFFSIIENLVNAIYFARMHNSRLVVPPESYWFPYPVILRDLFQSEIAAPFIRWGEKNIINPIDFERPRKFCQALKLKEIADFSSWKIAFYTDFLEGAVSILQRNGSSTVSENYGRPVVYLRGGDKLVLEVVLVPENIIETMLLAISGQFSDDILILSDSFNMAQNLVNRHPQFKLRNITRITSTGYFHDKKGNSAEDTIAILENFCLLAKSAATTSDPSSNLVNAAHWAKASPVISPVRGVRGFMPASRYLFF